MGSQAPTMPRAGGRVKVSVMFSDKVRWWVGAFGKMSGDIGERTEVGGISTMD